MITTGQRDFISQLAPRNRVTGSQELMMGSQIWPVWADSTDEQINSSAGSDRTHSQGVHADPPSTAESSNSGHIRLVPRSQCNPAPVGYAGQRSDPCRSLLMPNQVKRGRGHAIIVYTVALFLCLYWLCH